MEIRHRRTLSRRALVSLAVALAALVAAGAVGPVIGQGNEPPGAGAAAGDAERAEATERARAAAKALGGELMGRLTAEMAEGGPAAALRVCSEVAQEIAAAHSTAGVSVRRVSLRLRNRADRPDDYEREKLIALEAAHRRGELPEEIVEVVAGEAGRELRYLRPIVVGKLCLRCHGEPESFSPAVLEALMERYPHDEAVGYEVGDLRGAVSVRVALD